MSYIAEYGPALVRAGFRITPIRPGRKSPILPNWPEVHARLPDVQQWLAKGYGHHGIGILTEHTPAVDLDIYDAAVVNEMVDRCFEIAGVTLCRVGRPPKALLVYRTDTPFDRVESAHYDDGLCEHHLMILGRGQQFVALGIHPTTEAAYQWWDKDGVANERALVDTPLAELPTLNQGQAQEIVAAFDGIALRLGWALVSAASRSTRAKLDADEVLLAHAREKPTEVDVAGTLRTLQRDADHYEDWLRVGMALHHHFSGADEGLAHWVQWSQYTTRGNFDEFTCHFNWGKFFDKPRGRAPVTMRSLLQRARAVQADLSTADAKARLLTGVVEANGHSIEPPIDDRSPLNGFIERYVYVWDGDIVHDLHRPAHAADMQMKEFKNLNANKLMLVQDDQGKDKTKALAEIWLRCNRRLEAEKSEYTPGSPRLTRSPDGKWRYINAYALPDHPQDQGWTLDDPRLRTFMAHMDYLLPIEAERRWFVQWLAYTVARPEQRCKVSPLHISANITGTGRGWVIKLLERMLGDWNCKKTSLAILAGEGGAGAFQDYLHRSLVLSIEEVRVDKRYGVDDKIRDRLESHYLELNLKYGKKGMYHIYSNVFMMSNHHDALIIPRDDRRIEVLTGPVFKQDNAYYIDLYNWLDGEGPAQLYWCLCRLNLDHFNFQHSTQTPGRERMVEAVTSDTESTFRDWVTRQPPDREVLLPQLLLELSSEPYGLEEINEKDVVRLLREVATRSATRVAAVKGGVRGYAWRITRT